MVRLFNFTPEKESKSIFAGCVPYGRWMNPGGKLFEARSPLTVNFSILHQKSDSKCLILLGCEIHQLFLTAFALWSLNHLLYVWLMPWICTLVPWAFFWNQEWLINLNSFRFFCSQVAGLRSEIVSQLLTFIIIDSWSHLKSAYSLSLIHIWRCRRRG